MSKKYVIEIKPEYGDCFRGVMILGAKDSNLFVDTLAVENLEELNSDYINEHYGQLQDQAYQKGLEEGKAQNDIGCMGCAYVGLKESDEPCVRCSKCYKNQYRAKKKDDEINVGDEVDWEGDKFVVTRIFKPYNQKEQCDGVDADGCVYAAMLIENLTKTGRRFDVRFVEEK